MPVKDYNADPDLNTQISGINIAEGCAPSGINNAIRQLMADVKEEFEGEEGTVSSLDSTLRAFIAEEVAKYLPLAGGVMTGGIEFDRADGHIFKRDSEGRMVIRGGAGTPDAGASVYLYGADHPDDPGRLLLQSVAPGGGYLSLDLDKGKALIGEKNVVRSVNGFDADDLGNVRIKAENKGNVSANTLTEAGVYYVTGESTALPSGINGYIVVESTGGSSALRQIFYRVGTVNSNEHNIYTRGRASDGTWGSWVKMLTAKDGNLMTTSTVAFPSVSGAVATMPSGGTWRYVIMDLGDSSHVTKGSAAGGTKITHSDKINLAIAFKVAN